MKDWDRIEKDHEKISDLFDRLSTELIFDELLIPLSYWMSCKIQPRWTGLCLLLFGYQGENPHFIEGVRKAMDERRKKKPSTKQTKCDP